MTKDITLDVDSIDQILEKIKNAIESDTREPSIDGADPNILELTNIVHAPKEAKADSASQPIQNLTSKLNLLMKENNIISEREIREIFKETLRPYLKSWLNNNIKSLAKEVIEAEVKRMFKR